MPVLEMIDAALAPLKLKHGVGSCTASPSVDHYVLLPDMERGFEADNDDLYTDEHVNIEFYLGGNYRTVLSSAKSLLKAAGITVLESRYVISLLELWRLIRLSPSRYLVGTSLIPLK